MIKFLLRTVLVALAFTFAMPLIAGAKFHGDWLGAATTSLVFNTLVVGLEWLLGVIVFGINIGTLGLGVIITTGLKFVATLLTPSVALYGTAQLMPRFLQIADFYPVALVSGLMLGGIIWATVPAKKTR